MIMIFQALTFIYFIGLILLKIQDKSQDQNYSYIIMATLINGLAILLQIVFLKYRQYFASSLVTCNLASGICIVALLGFDDHFLAQQRHSAFRSLQYVILGGVLQMVVKELTLLRNKILTSSFGVFFLLSYNFGQYYRSNNEKWLTVVLFEIILILIISHHIWQHKQEYDQTIKCRSDQYNRSLRKQDIKGRITQRNLTAPLAVQQISSEININEIGFQQQSQIKKIFKGQHLDGDQSPILSRHCDDQAQLQEEDRFKIVLIPSNVVNEIQNQNNVEMKQQKNFFKILFNQFPDGMIILAENNKIEYQNQCLREILNTKNSQDTLQTLLELKNCQNEFQEQTKFLQLFQVLNKKLISKNSADQQNNKSVQSISQADLDQFNNCINNINLNLDDDQVIEEYSLDSMDNSFDHQDQFHQNFKAYISDSSTVQIEYDKAIKKAQTLTQQKQTLMKQFSGVEQKMGRENSSRSRQSAQKEKFKFLYEIKILCRLNKNINSNQGGSSDLSDQEPKQILDVSKLLEITMKPYLHDQKAFVFIIIRDVTLFNEFTVLQQINENKSKMLYQVAHEFRTPLNCIILLIETLLEDYRSNTKLCQDFFQPILTSASQLLSLINDLLDLAQLKAGKFKLQFQDFDLKQQLYAISTMLTPAVAAKGLKLNLIIDNNLPSLIRSDHNRIRQIVINLISNSIKFTSKGSITIDVKHLTWNETQISVVDTGCGIPKEDQGKLFQAFGKLEATSDINTQGVGLGLMISHILAQKIGLSPLKDEQLNEGLQVFSEGKGQGSTFSFNIYSHREYQQENPGQIQQDQQKITPDKNYKQEPNISLLHFDQRGDMRQRSSINSSRIVVNPSKLEVMSQKYITSDSKIGYAFHVVEDEQNIQPFKSELKVGMNELELKRQSRQKILSINLGKQSHLKVIHNKLNNLKICKNIPSIVGEQRDEFSPKGLFDAHQQIDSLYNFKNCLCPEVLIIDDEAFNILALRARLQKYQVKLDSATAYQEVIDKLTHIKQSSCCKWIKLILMDISMPGKDGFEVTKNIRQMEQGLRDKQVDFEQSYIVGCSGFGMDQKEQCIKSGMNDYLCKPVQLNQILNLIQGRVSNYKENRRRVDSLKI